MSTTHSSGADAEEAYFQLSLDLLVALQSREMPKALSIAETLQSQYSVFVDESPSSPVKALLHMKPQIENAPATEEMSASDESEGEGDDAEEEGTSSSDSALESESSSDSGSDEESSDTEDVDVTTTTTTIKTKDGERGGVAVATGGASDSVSWQLQRLLEQLREQQQQSSGEYGSLNSYEEKNSPIPAPPPRRTPSPGKKGVPKAKAKGVKTEAKASSAAVPKKKDKTKTSSPKENAAANPASHRKGILDDDDLTEDERKLMEQLDNEVSKEMEKLAKVRKHR